MLRHVTKKIPITTPSETVGSIRRTIEQNTDNYTTINYVYVVDAEHKLVGVLSLRHLLAAHSDTKIAQLIPKSVVVAHEDTPLEKVAVLAVQHNIKAIPIVDSQHRLVGVVPNDVILGTLYHKMRATLLRSAGIHPNHTESILELSLFTAFRHRILWIVVGLFGGLLAAGIVESFSATLSQDLVLAAFIPLVVYIGDAVGTQTQTLYVRDVASEGALPLSYVIRQLIVSLLLSVTSGVVVLGIVSVFFHSLPLGMIIALSTMAGIMVASVIGIAIPYVLFLLNQDPADGSGPFATILTDIASVAIYFAVASLFVF